VSLAAPMAAADRASTRFASPALATITDDVSGVTVADSKESSEIWAAVSRRVSPPVTSTV